MATKKEIRDQVRNAILFTAMGKMKNKTTGEIYTLQTLPEDVIQKMNEKLQEKKISRKSVYSAIQACSYRVLDKDDETTMNKIHDFCFTKLVKGD